MKSVLYAMWPATAVEAVGIDCSTSANILRSQWLELSLEYPIITDPQRNLFRLYQVESTSTFLVVDPQGVVRYRQIGFDQQAIVRMMRLLVTQ